MKKRLCTSSLSMFIKYFPSKIQFTTTDERFIDTLMSHFHSCLSCQVCVCFQNELKNRLITKPTLNHTPRLYNTQCVFALHFQGRTTSELGHATTKTNISIKLDGHGLKSILNVPSLSSFPFHCTICGHVTFKSVNIKQLVHIILIRIHEVLNVNIFKYFAVYYLHSYLR